MSISPYIFTSPRLGFRNWTDADLDAMSAINTSEKAMQYFPATQSREQTAAFILRMQQLYRHRGFCYFAVDKLDDGTFIGFIGLAEQAYDAPFTPCVDIGWRLHPDHWGRGYATEGARACLEYGFEWCGLTEIYAVCPAVNLPSEQVMLKVGMQKTGVFDHPLLTNYQGLRPCVYYRASRF